LVASNVPLPFDLKEIHHRLAQPGILESLRAAGLPETPEGILARRVADSDSLRIWSENSPPLTRDLPLLEYALTSTYSKSRRLRQQKRITTLTAHPLRNPILLDHGVATRTPRGDFFLPQAGILLQRPLAELTSSLVLRRPPPPASPLALETDWEAEISAGGRIHLRSTPVSVRPTAHVEHQRALGSPLKGDEAHLGGHNALWSLRSTGEPGKWQALFTWNCSQRQRSHSLEIFFSAASPEASLLLDMAEQITCHPVPEASSKRPPW
jgi:hypothetical protein